MLINDQGSRSLTANSSSSSLSVSSDQSAATSVESMSSVNLQIPEVREVKSLPQAVPEANIHPTASSVSSVQSDAHLQVWSSNVNKVSRKR